MNSKEYQLGDTVFFIDNKGNINQGEIIEINHYDFLPNGTLDIDHPWDFVVQTIDKQEHKICRHQIIDSNNI